MNKFFDTLIEKFGEPERIASTHFDPVDHYIFKTGLYDTIGDEIYIYVTCMDDEGIEISIQDWSTAKFVICGFTDKDDFEWMLASILRFAKYSCA
jgi:hypothetical protein